MKQFITGFLCGAVAALLVAAGGALFVTESPVPFMSKVQSSSQAYIEEALKGRSPDPNEKLYAPGTTPRPAASAASSSPVAASSTAPAAASSPAAGISDAAVPAPAPAPVQPQNPAFFIQVGSYKTADEAETIRAKIAFSGLDSSVSHGKDGYYRVRVGPFESESAAQNALGTLKSNDLPGQIIH
ncbi:SPOR domain-containing protein [Mesosutterella sp. OilRF-GAM-744-9]|uniref:SPOR domain-containing protein n=1 Tax=Mesosutterella porci TaxID=2915351 RepID=A0ABS9MR91_9BURK|nr:SPOR domain-containing protein [Mesosutterella sp. oilRF-744-WT-GAM-9]MCG5031150.1 SPOR domain-containing protein [Mesosutterella sp. oilRF-744-WT-GAM-9]MCI6531345.1 SPOR domain-containing protein [Mesosutterella sp.]